MAKLTRRDALGALTVPALAAASGVEAAEAPKTTFTLLLVNDIYKLSPDKGQGGFAKLAAIVKAERARGTPMLFAHAGDTYSPSLMSGFDQGEHIVTLTNMVKPDIFVPGNHEFDFGKDIYFKRVAASNFPIFAANMRGPDGKPLPRHVDRRIFELGGIKVGVTGIALAETPLMSSPGDIKFLPVIETLSEQARALRAEGAEFLVAVTHTDRAMDYRIVRSRLVDVLLTGHDHDLAVAYDGKTVMVESNEEGNYVTAIDITVNVRGEGAARQLSWSPSFRVNDSAAFAPDPEVGAKVQSYEALLSRELDVPVARVVAPLDSRSALIRSQETSMGDLVADAIRAAERANAAIFNGGGIRGNTVYEPGTELTRRNILTELPFGNRTVVTEITGRALHDALETGFSQADRRAGRFPQVSGLKVFVDLKRPPGTRVVSLDVDGKPVDAAATYRVATNDFLLLGGDGYTSLGGDGKATADTGARLVANDVMVYARRLGSIDIKPEGRIVIQP